MTVVNDSVEDRVGQRGFSQRLHGLDGQVGPVLSRQRCKAPVIQRWLAMSVDPELTPKFSKQIVGLNKQRSELRQPTRGHIAVKFAPLKRLGRSPAQSGDGIEAVRSRKDMVPLESGVGFCQAPDRKYLLLR